MTVKTKIILLLLLYFFSFSNYACLSNSYTGIEEERIIESTEKLSCEDDLNNLIQSLSTGDVEKRRKATKTLGDLKCINSVSSLVKALKDDDRTVRVYAAYALGEIKDTKAIFDLKPLLDDENEIVRLSAIEALGKMEEGCSEDDLKKAEGKLNEIIKNNIDNQSFFKIETAVEAMRYVGTENSISSIIDIIEKKDYNYSSIHNPALESLRNIGNKEAIEYIEEYVFTNNENFLVNSRAKGIEILGEIGDADIIDELKRIQIDNECQIVVDAVQQAIETIKKRNLELQEPATGSGVNDL